jgi:transposase
VSGPGRVVDMSVPGEWVLLAFAPHLAGLRVGQVADDGDGVWLAASSRAVSACCPVCGSPSSRVHACYTRTIADLPAGGRPVRVVLSVRRFRCLEQACRRTTFAEQVPGFSARYRRRSVPLLALLAGTGLELAGRAGARMAAVLGTAVHPSTVLREVMALPAPEVSAAPEITGIDDFALRKGHVYGTVIIDVRTGDVADLLPDREAGTVAEWFRARPGASVICRDRARAYGDAARDGAPDAAQVADLWHLWHNLGERAAETAAAHRASCLTPHPDSADPGSADPGSADPGSADPDGADPDGADPDGAGPVPVLAGPGPGERPAVTRARERHAAIHQLLAAGHSKTAVAAALNLCRQTVSRYAAAATAGDILPAARDSALDPYKPWLHQAWNEGTRDAATLHAEITARGYTGHIMNIYRYIQPFRALPAAPPPPPAIPSARQITRCLMTRPAALTPDQQATLADITARCPHLAVLHGLITSFAAMMNDRTGFTDLTGWLTAAEASDLPALHSYAAGIRADRSAVTTALTWTWTNGKTEGTVNKIKMIKRQMYGRARFPLLRQRVLLHPA